MPRKYWTCAGGMTLIEVLAGTALLGSLLVMLLLAQAALARLGRRAAEAVEAARVADEFLTEYLADNKHLPRGGAGSIQRHPGWSWSVEPVAGKAGAAARAVYRLSVCRRQDAEPAAVVEYVMSAVSDEQTTTTRPDAD